MGNPIIVSFVKAVSKKICHLPDGVNYIMMDYDGEVKFSREKPIMGDTLKVWIRSDIDNACYHRTSFRLDEFFSSKPIMISRDEYLKIRNELQSDAQVRFFRNDLRNNGHNTVCCMLKNHVDNPRMFVMSVSVVSKDDIFSRKKAWEILSARHINGETIQGYWNSSLSMDFNIQLALQNHVKLFPDDTLYPMALRSVTCHMVEDFLGTWP